MSKRLRYFLGIRSKLLGRNLAQQNTSLETAIILASLIPKALDNSHCIDPKIYQPCVWNTKRVSSSLWMSIRRSWMVGSICLY